MCSHDSARERRGVEEPVHERRVGEEELRRQHRGDAAEDPAVGEEADARRIEWVSERQLKR